MPIIAERIDAIAGLDARAPFLRGVSVTLNDGEMTLIVGRTGSGKTTLLNALCGLKELQAGSVRYDGHPLWRKRKVNPAVNRRLGAVFQQPEQQLFAATVRKEFRYSLRHLALSPETAEARMLAAMEIVGLAADMPDRSPFELSTGQQRRVALATTFAAGPEWLFLDEPTSGLDPEGVRLLAEWLCRWRSSSGCGMVVVTHDLDTFLPLADRVLVMVDGCISADVTRHELLNRPELLLEAGVGLPAYWETAVLLQRAGLDVPAGASADDMALAIAAALRRGPANAAAEAATVATLIEQPPASEEPAGSTAGSGRRQSWADRLDPRAKWVFLLVATAGMLMQRSWGGVGLAALLTVVLITAARIPLRPFLHMLRAYLPFAAISAAVAGLAWSGNGIAFSVSGALETALSLLRLAPAMLLGQLFARTTTPMAVMRSLEWALSPLVRLRAQADMLTFSAGMLFRLLPLLAAQLERFSRIVRMRGKSRAKPGSLALRDVPGALAPLLVTSFQLVEQLALAVEAKGYRFGKRRTSYERLHFRKEDVWTVAAGLALLAGLMLLR
jgi:energy-coupling factor transport system ATP-binding protein